MILKGDFDFKSFLDLLRDKSLANPEGFYLLYFTVRCKRCLLVCAGVLSSSLTSSRKRLSDRDGMKYAISVYACRISIALGGDSKMEVRWFIEPAE